MAVCLIAGALSALRYWGQNHLIVAPVISVPDGPGSDES